MYGTDLWIYVRDTLFMQCYVMRLRMCAIGEVYVYDVFANV